MTSDSNPTTFTRLSDREGSMSRVFDAPRELVFSAYTDPAHIPHWWGPRDVKTTVDTMDVKPGGAWRYVHRGADGAEYGFRGEYREVVPPERLVSTFEFEPMPGHIVVDTAIFEDLDGKTRLTVTSLFQSAADFDGMLESGMESGATESWDRLAELLATLK
ncbi:MAG: SRPBCC family protein [Chloroflexota bacterium]|nr:SRPBCC family protein [Chloroflexota bacterium]